MTETRKLDLVQRIRPLHLMTLIVLYILGVGFGRYLGHRIDPAPLMIGLAWILTLAIGLNFLGDYFHTPFDRGLVRKEQDEKDSHDKSLKSKDEIYLYISVACLAVGAVLTLILGISGFLSFSSGLVMASFFVLYCLLIIPGVSLDLSGIGEFFTSIILVVLPPAIGYLLQVGEFHRFLYLGVFPLFPLHLALILVLRLKTYPDDIRISRKTLLVRLGWQRGIYLHNLMVLSGFLLFGVALIFGMPFRLILPVFLTLPVAGYLIWYLSSLQDGAPVRWPLITLLSLVIFFLPVYLITYTVWVR
ncbi:MAG: prenyltransferase [Anaerolineales bacterium]|nr:prenyltransferase [Anaerolineales bacterium]